MGELPGYLAATRHLKRLHPSETLLLTRRYRVTGLISQPTKVQGLYRGLLSQPFSQPQCILRSSVSISFTITQALNALIVGPHEQFNATTGLINSSDSTMAPANTLTCLSRYLVAEWVTMQHPAARAVAAEASKSRCRRPV